MGSRRFLDSWYKKRELMSEITEPPAGKKKEGEGTKRSPTSGKKEKKGKGGLYLRGTALRFRNGLQRKNGSLGCFWKGVLRKTKGGG